MISKLWKEIKDFIKHLNNEFEKKEHYKDINQSKWKNDY